MLSLLFPILQAPSFYSQDIPPNATFPGYHLKSRRVTNLPMRHVQTGSRLYYEIEMVWTGPAQLAGCIQPFVDSGRYKP